MARTMCFRKASAQISKSNSDGLTSSQSAAKTVRVVVPIGRGTGRQRGEVMSAQQAPGGRAHRARCRAGSCVSSARPCQRGGRDAVAPDRVAIPAAARGASRRRSLAARRRRRRPTRHPEDGGAGPAVGPRRGSSRTSRRRRPGRRRGRPRRCDRRRPTRASGGRASGTGRTRRSPCTVASVGVGWPNPRSAYHDSRASCEGDRN